MGDALEQAAEHLSADSRQLIPGEQIHDPAPAQPGAHRDDPTRTLVRPRSRGRLG